MEISIPDITIQKYIIPLMEPVNVFLNGRRLADAYINLNMITE